MENRWKYHFWDGDFISTHQICRYGSEILSQLNLIVFLKLYKFLIQKEHMNPLLPHPKTVSSNKCSISLPPTVYWWRCDVLAWVDRSNVSGWQINHINIKVAINRIFVPCGHYIFISKTKPTLVAVSIFGRKYKELEIWDLV